VTLLLAAAPLTIGSIVVRSDGRYQKPPEVAPEDLVDRLVEQAVLHR